MQARNSNTGFTGSKVSRAITVALLAFTLVAGGGIANVAEAQAATAAQVRHARATKVRRAKAKRARALKARRARAAKVRAHRAAARRRAALRTRSAAKARHAASARKKRAAALRKSRKKRVSRSYGAGWHTAEVSWYGPGFYGHGMAGGGVLTKTSMIVAHKTLPFGTKVEFSYKGKTVIATVRDRGPFVSGREFDFGPGIARSLHMYSVANVQYRIVGL